MVDQDRDMTRRGLLVLGGAGVLAMVGASAAFAQGATPIRSLSVSNVVNKTNQILAAALKAGAPSAFGARWQPGGAGGADLDIAITSVILAQLDFSRAVPIDTLDTTLTLRRGGQVIFSKDYFAGVRAYSSMAGPEDANLDVLRLQRLANGYLHWLPGKVP